MLLELSAPLPTIRPGARTPLTYPQINSPSHLDPARNFDARLRTVVGQLQAKNPDSARNPPIGFHPVPDNGALLICVVNPHPLCPVANDFAYTAVTTLVAAILLTTKPESKRSRECGRDANVLLRFFSKYVLSLFAPHIKVAEHVQARRARDHESGHE
jgi:hypothetical protein